MGGQDTRRLLQPTVRLPRPRTVPLADPPARQPTAAPQRLEAWAVGIVSGLAQAATRPRRPREDGRGEPVADESGLQNRGSVTADWPVSRPDRQSRPNWPSARLARHRLLRQGNHVPARSFRSTRVTAGFGRALAGGRGRPLTWMRKMVMP